MSSHGPARLGQTATPRKRPRDSEPPTGPLSGQKRDKYTLNACTECRKRKIKCTGNVPCRRCENFDLSCLYSQSSADAGHQSSSSRSKIASLEQNLEALQTQVEQLSNGLKQVWETNQHSQNSPEINQGQAQAQVNVLDAANRGRSGVTKTQPRFIGPTSSAYNFNVANNTLQMMGIQLDETEDLSLVASALPSRSGSPETTLPVEVPKDDPLFSIGLEEIYGSLELYREELHSVYPFINIARTVQLVPSIYEHLRHRSISNSVSNVNDRCCATTDRDVEVLKLIISCALVVEGGGQSRLGQLLIDGVDTMLCTSARAVEVDLQGLRIVTLASIYYFQSDEPVLAWRTIGFAARIALEMGLHRRESLEESVPDPQEREWATKLFWCIYVLDRRWSFGIGMPFALQDSDIDPGLSRLGIEPYLESLIAYGRICSKVWTAVAGYNHKLIDKDAVAYLDFQIQQWQLSLPSQYQLLHPRLGEGASNQPRSLQRLRVLLYVRANQMRGYIYRHNILSASSISENLDGARRIVDIAKDTITVLVHLRETSTIYDTQQSAFNYFLVSAISAIFLAVCHAPAEFSHSCRNEFYSALGIVKDLSARSYISRRLWKSVQRLRSIAPKLGLAPIKPRTGSQDNNKNESSQSYTAARPYNPEPPAAFTTAAPVDMTGSSQTIIHPHSGYNVDALSQSFPAAPADVEAVSETSFARTPDMHWIGSELTTLFEAFDQFVDGQQLDTVSPYMTEEEINSLQSGTEISRLFEGLL